VVVHPNTLVGVLLRLIQVVEQVGRQDVFAKRAIQTLQAAILGGLSRLDVSKFNLMLRLLAPIAQGLSQKLWSVIYPDGLGLAAPANHLDQPADDLGGRYALSYGDVRIISVLLIHDVGTAKRLTIDQGVAYEIHTPKDIRPNRSYQRSSYRLSQSAQGTTLDVQASYPVEPVEPLVMDWWKVLHAQSIVRLPKAPSGSLFGHLGQPSQHLLIVWPGLGLVAKR
jgi:hypothetical protein